MATHSFTLVNEHGLHARPAGLIVQTCSKFKSSIALIKNGQSFNCKSVLGIMKMGAAKGDQLTLEVTGEDEVEALAAMQALIASNFNE